MSKFYTRPRSSSPIFQLTPLFFTPNHSSRRLTHSLGYWLNTICTFFAKINKIVPQCSVLTSFTFFYPALPLLLCLTLQMFAPHPLLCSKFGQLCLPDSLCYSHTASLNETGINIPRLQLYFIVTCFLLSRGSSSAQAVERPSSHVEVSWVPVRLSHGDKSLNNCGAAAKQTPVFSCYNCCDDLCTCFLLTRVFQTFFFGLFVQLVSTNPKTATTNPSSNQKLPL